MTMHKEHKLNSFIGGQSSSDLRRQGNNDYVTIFLLDPFEG